MAGDRADANVSCEGVRENLDAYLDGELGLELSAGDQAAFEAHLASCEECLARLERRKALVGLVRELPRPKAPAGLAGRIVASALPERPRVTLRLRTWAPALAVAAVLFLAAVVGLHSTGEVRAPAEGALDAGAPRAAPAAEAKPSLDEAGSGAEVALARDREGAREADEARKLLSGARRGEPEEAARADAADAAPAERASREPAPAALARKGAAPAAPSRRGAAPARAAPSPLAARDSSKAKETAAVMKKGDRAAARAPAKAGMKEALRFEEKAVAVPPGGPAEGRAPRAKEGARLESEAPIRRKRSALRAAGGRYERGRRTKAGAGAILDGVDAAREGGEALGKAREAPDEALNEALEGKRDEDVAQVGQSAVIPQGSRLPRQAATFGRERGVRTGRLVLSRVAGVRGGGEGGKGRDMVARIPIATPDAPATRRLVMRLARESGGELALGRARGGVLEGPGVTPTAPAAPATKGGRSAGGPAAAAEARAVVFGWPDGKVIVRIAGAKAEAFLRRIDARFGEVAVRFATVVEEVNGVPRKVYRAVRHGSVLQRLPDLKGLAEVTVEFELLPAASAEADLAPRSEDARAARALEVQREAEEPAADAAGEAPAQQ